MKTNCCSYFSNEYIYTLPEPVLNIPALQGPGIYEMRCDRSKIPSQKLISKAEKQNTFEL